jgi:Tat protein secretion system quality control protein TatD with DNase activity
VSAAVAAGVTRMVTMGVDEARSRVAIALSRATAVWAGVGHHPTEMSPPDIEVLRGLAADPRHRHQRDRPRLPEEGAPPRSVQVERLHDLCDLAVSWTCRVHPQSRRGPGCSM